MSFGLINSVRNIREIKIGPINKGLYSNIKRSTSFMQAT